MFMSVGIFVSHQLCPFRTYFKINIMMGFIIVNKKCDWGKFFQFLVKKFIISCGQGFKLQRNKLCKNS